MAITDSYLLILLGTPSPRIYKGGQGYLDRQRTSKEPIESSQQATQHLSAGCNIQHPKTGHRVLRYSGGLNLSKFVSCVLAFTFKFQIR
jgi:hypothetical protein